MEVIDITFNNNLYLKISIYQFLKVSLYA